MTKTANKKCPATAAFEDIAPYFPDHLRMTEKLLRAKSGAGQFPPSHFTFSQKDKPRWSRQEVAGWFQAIVFPNDPEWFYRLIHDGNFPMPTVPLPDRPALRPSKYKANAKSRRKTRMPVRESEREPANRTLPPKAKKERGAP